MKVTVLGMGTMGSAMAANLRRHGFDTTVWDRNPDKARALASAGASVASTPAQAVAEADTVITMLADGDAVVSVMESQGALDALRQGAIWAQMSTIGVAATEHFIDVTRQRRPDVLFVDAPVSGSKPAAEAAQLIVLASGPDDAKSRVMPVFEALGRRTVWLGEAGRGSRLKLVLNTWLAFLMEGLAETLTMADDLGIHHAEVLDVLEGSPLAAQAAIAKAHKIDTGDDDVEFSLIWALKDVKLALAATSRRLPALTAIAEQWEQAAAEGFGRSDVSAAYRALKEDQALRSG